MGYAWTSELARRLRAQLTLFTTMYPPSPACKASIYQALAAAQGLYVKNFQLLPLRLSPVKTQRYFEAGEFEPTLNAFLAANEPLVTVIQSGIFTISAMKSVIESRRQVIILPDVAIGNDLVQTASREDRFLAILGEAAFYNPKRSFFNKLAGDQSLSNSLTQFFRRRMHNPAH
jgi:hypothetical protein